MAVPAGSEGLIGVYRGLERTYALGPGWPEGEWPISHCFDPPRLEIVVGAILTQNVSWSNVEKTLPRLISEGLTTARAIADRPPAELEEIIRPTGFFRQKASRLQQMVLFVLNHDDFFQRVRREELLAVKGVGPETADSILLYACDRCQFVVDAYTRRLLCRYGLVEDGAGYHEIQQLFHGNIPPRLSLYKRFHALIVEHAKRTCKKRPLCRECVLNAVCQASNLGPDSS